MFNTGFPPEWSTLKKLIWLVGSGIAGAAKGVWKTVTGTLIHITDALASPMQKCEVSLEPIQDLHGQDAPYPAGGGKNKFNPTDGDVGKWCGSSGDIYDNVGGYISPSYTPSGTKLTASWENNGIYSYIYICYDANGDFLSREIYYASQSGTTYTLPEGTVSVRFGVSGSNITITTDIVASWKIQVEEGQTATPYSPNSNICPITGWTGCEVNVTGKNLVNKADGKVYAAPRFMKLGVNDYADTLPNGSIKLGIGDYVFSFSGENSTNFESIGIYDDTGTRIKLLYNNKICSFTTTKACAYRIDLAIQSELFVSWDNYDIQLEAGTTPTAYEPFGTTLSVTFPDTVYGGSHEFVSGGLKSKMASVDLGTLTWQKYAQSNNWIFYANVPSGRTSVGGDAIKLLCSVYPCSQTSKSGSQALAGSDKLASWDSTNSQILIKDLSYSDAASFKTAMSGVQLVYELAEPITYQLTPQEISTLRGENNVWGDGTIELTYKAQSS